MSTSLLSKYLEEKSDGILKIQPEVSDNTNRYQMFDSGAVSVEEAEFLYGLIRVLKPLEVLTTGIFTGISDMYIAQALIDNEIGKLTALEIGEHHLQRARSLWEKVGVISVIDSKLISSLDFIPDKEFELIFLDSEPEIRFKELVKFYPNLKLGGYIGIHDLPVDLVQGNINPDHPNFPSWPYGNVPEEMKQLLKEGKLIRFHLPTPRDCAFFYSNNKI